jgi:YidC/Oxa1 family membrane protein insertase
MDKRAIIAIVLSMMVILIWQLIFAPAPKKEPAIMEERVEKRVIEDRGEGRLKEDISEYREEEKREVQDVVVETPLYRAVFTTGGGKLRSWTLNKYMDRVKTVVLLRRVELPPPAPVEMVTVRGTDSLPLETEIQLDGNKPEDLVFDVDISRLSVEAGKEGSILFVGRLGENLDIVKRYRFYGDHYRVDLDIEIINRSDLMVKPELSLKWFGVIKPGSRYTYAGPSVFSGRSVERLKAKEIRKGRTFTEEIKWIASENTNPPEHEAPEGNYFVSLIAPERKDGVKVEVREREIPESEGIGFESRITLPQTEVGAGGDERYSFLLYIGPKQPELLKSLDVGAEKAINFGKFLGSIEKVLLRILEFTHRLTGNYGVDIIMLSILLKVVFWPLSRKSYKSMQEMQKVQPEMKMLQEKYKDDRQRLNQEMMALYKRRKVNPVGGCLPMLVQFPFLIALYRALPLDFSLRHAPFMLWLQDLSGPDMFFVDQLPLPLLGNTPVGPLPLLMGVSMLIQQKMSPTMGDPRQARMMMFMPIMFIFIFLSFPSGLVLYWFVQNILSIGEQYYTRRKGK